MAKKMPVRRWVQGLKRAMPVVLDTAAIMLLSGSANLFFGLAAGLAALGVGLLVLNRVHNG